MWSVEASIAISARDKDVAMRAGGKVRSKIEGRIVRVVEHEQPLLALSRKPLKCGFLRLAYAFGNGDIAEVRVDGLLRAGVNIKDVREP